MAWVASVTTSTQHQGQTLRTGLGGVQFYDWHVSGAWPVTGSYLGALGQLMTLRADAEQRLGLANSAPSIDILEGPAVAPLQRLLRDHEAEKRLSEAAQRAFGKPVCVNRAGGAQISLHVGKPEAEARLDNATYLEELRRLPQVASQGDGMRSFIGLLLTLYASDYPVVLIDEPEAFLHPPQARELGRRLASGGGQQRRRNAQRRRAPRPP